MLQDFLFQALHFVPNNWIQKFFDICTELFVDQAYQLKNQSLYPLNLVLKLLTIHLLKIVLSFH
ncbi:Uncharacterised protein [Chlamydia trachomatis]|nr:Uncharacterised protein [Chlamydia trachomatis]